jgi:hypothetical protein
VKYDNTKRYTTTAADRMVTAAAIADVETRRDRMLMAHAAGTDALVEAASVAAVTVDRREMAADIRRLALVAVEAMRRSNSMTVRGCIDEAGGQGAVNASVLRLLAKLDDAGADGTLVTYRDEPLPTLATDAPCAMDGLDYTDGAP